MRYFLYINSPTKQTIVIVDENSDTVDLYPPERANHCSQIKKEWLDYYNCLTKEGKATMFEICRRQFEKFVRTGVTPENHDAYFVAQQTLWSAVMHTLPLSE